MRPSLRSLPRAAGYQNALQVAILSLFLACLLLLSLRSYVFKPHS